MSQSSDPITICHDFGPGDLGSIVSLHGTVYSQEYGFDPTFEAYVAGPLADFVRERSNRDRIWIAKRASQIVGCIAIVEKSAKEAQLRWYLVDPGARGLGLGKLLMTEAIAFCEECGYESVFLWTVSALTTAAKIYRAFGFELIEQKPGGHHWGVPGVEEKYVLILGSGKSTNSGMS
jgi:GNAT superfamily N-acetyltransferase